MNIKMAANFDVLESISYLVFTSVISNSLVENRWVKYFTMEIACSADKPDGEGALTPGASAANRQMAVSVPMAGRDRTAVPVSQN